MESGQLTPLLEALQPKFDIVILDTPPAGVFSDAFSLARIAHELVYVCRFNMVSRQQARAVIDRLRLTGLSLPGVVLNAMPAGRSNAYYYRGYNAAGFDRYVRHYREGKA